MSRPPLPPFTDATAAEKARLAEDAWNSRDPARVALAYTVDSAWRNRAGISNTGRVGKVLNDHRADWREAWALFPGDVAYVWHGALHAATVAESLRATGAVLHPALAPTEPGAAEIGATLHLGLPPTASPEQIRDAVELRRDVRDEPRAGPQRAGSRYAGVRFDIDANLRADYCDWAELVDACGQFCDDVNARPHRVTRRAPVEMLAGDELTRRRPEKIRARGLAVVPEGRRLFPDMTVRENLEMGAFSRKDRAGIRARRGCRARTARGARPSRASASRCAWGIARAVSP